jgi:O-acetyl-ADP-ribose deacetylase (regulator of RNase III)
VLRDWRSKSEEIAETASGVKVFLTQHSLTRIEIEAIVSGDSSDGEMKGDAAEAISWEAGIRDESLVKFKEPHNSGAWITGPGRLDVEHVIHVKVADRPGAGDASQITSAVVSALRGAESIGVREVAFPAFGTGTGGLTLRASAYAMADGLTNYRGSDPNAQVDTVLVVVYKEDMREDFAGMMRTRLEQLNEGRNEASNTY